VGGRALWGESDFWLKEDNFTLRITSNESVMSTLQENEASCFTVLFFQRTVTPSTTPT
jgi:hypothetical protein